MLSVQIRFLTQLANSNCQLGKLFYSCPRSMHAYLEQEQEQDTPFIQADLLICARRHNYSPNLLNRRPRDLIRSKTCLPLPLAHQPAPPLHHAHALYKSTSPLCVFLIPHIKVKLLSSPKSLENLSLPPGSSLSLSLP